MLRVTYTTAEQQAVGYYRVILPVETLVAQGEVEVVPMPEIKVSCIDRGGKTVVVGVEDPPDSDVLILQRPTTCHIVDAIPFYQRLGIAVVIDLDDDLENVRPGHNHNVYYDPKRNQVDNWNHLRRACRMADMVVVSTDALRRYADPHHRCAVVRNCVPASYLDIETVSDGNTVGWGGTVVNHVDDLKVTHGGVAKAVRDLGLRFSVVGDGGFVKDQLGLDEEPDKTGLVQINRYPHFVATFSVGIAPLVDNAFNRAKSWLKGLEYCSLGVLPVASDLPEYRLLQKHIGYDLLPLVADRGRNWCSAVKKQFLAADDVDNRLEVRERASELTVENNADYWLDAWEEAIEHRLLHG